MTVPPYVVACAFCITGGYLADKFKSRGVFMIGFFCIALVGFVMLIASTNHGVQYAGVFFVAAGIYSNVPQGVSWNGNNIGGSTKRGAGVAMHVSFGNLGGIIAAYIYRPADSPRYLSGHGTLIGLITMSTCLSIFMTLYLRRENKRRDAVKPVEAYTEAERVAERERGDYASFFRYTV